MRCYGNLKVNYRNLKVRVEAARKIRETLKDREGGRIVSRWYIEDLGEWREATKAEVQAAHAAQMRGEPWLLISAEDADEARERAERFSEEPEGRRGDES